MGVQLEELILEFAADNTKLDAAIDRAVAKARSAGTQIERIVATSLSKGSGLNLTPKVDHQHLEALNKHLDIKKRHFQDVQRYFNSKPLIPDVDTSQIDRANDYLKVFKQQLVDVPAWGGNIAIAATLQHQIDGSNLSKSFQDATDKFKDAGDEVANKIVENLKNVRLKTTTGSRGIVGTVVSGAFSLGAGLLGGIGSLLGGTAGAIINPIVKTATAGADQIIREAAKDLYRGADIQASVRNGGKASRNFIQNRGGEFGDVLARELLLYEKGLSGLGRDLINISKLASDFLHPEPFFATLEKMELRFGEFLHRSFYRKDLGGAVEILLGDIISPITDPIKKTKRLFSKLDLQGDLNNATYGARYGNPEKIETALKEGKRVAQIAAEIYAEDPDAKKPGDKGYFKALSNKMQLPNFNTQVARQYVNEIKEEADWDNIKRPFFVLLRLVRTATGVVRKMNAIEMGRMADDFAKEYRTLIPDLRPGEKGYTIYASGASGYARGAEEHAPAIQAMFPGTRVYAPTIPEYEFSKQVPTDNFFKQIAQQVAGGSTEQMVGIKGGPEAWSDLFSHVLFGYSTAGARIMGAQKAASAKVGAENVQTIGFSIGSQFTRAAAEANQYLNIPHRSMGLGIAEFFDPFAPTPKNYTPVYSNEDSLNLPVLTGILHGGYKEQRVNTGNLLNPAKHAIQHIVSHPQFPEIANQFQGFDSSSLGSKDLQSLLANMSEVVQANRTIKMMQNLRQGKDISEDVVSRPYRVAGINRDASLRITESRNLEEAFKLASELLEKTFGQYAPASESLLKIMRESGRELDPKLFGVLTDTFERLQAEILEFTSHFVGTPIKTVEEASLAFGHLKTAVTTYTEITQLAKKPEADFIKIQSQINQVLSSLPISRLKSSFLQFKSEIDKFELGWVDDIKIELLENLKGRFDETYTDEKFINDVSIPNAIAEPVIPESLRIAYESAIHTNTQQVTSNPVIRDIIPQQVNNAATLPLQISQIEQEVERSIQELSKIAASFDSASASSRHLKETNPDKARIYAQTVVNNIDRAIAQVDTALLAIPPLARTSTPEGNRLSGLKGRLVVAKNKAERVLMSTGDSVQKAVTAIEEVAKIPPVAISIPLLSHNPSDAILNLGNIFAQKRKELAALNGAEAERVATEILVSADEAQKAVADLISGLGKNMPTDLIKTAQTATKKIQGAEKTASSTINASDINVDAVVGNIASGLSGGIAQKIEEVRRAGKLIGEAVIEGAESKLEISSPSRVFFRIGLFVVRGLEKGVQALNLDDILGTKLSSQLQDIRSKLQQQLQPIETEVERTARLTGADIGRVAANTANAGVSQVEIAASHVERVREQIRQDILPVAKSGFAGFKEGFAQEFQGIQAQFPVLQRFKGLIRDITVSALALVGVFTFGDAIATVGRTAFQVALEFERLETALNFSTAGRGIETLALLRGEADRLGLSFRESAKGYQQFSSATLGTSLESQTEDIFAGFRDAAAARILTPQATESLFRAVSQMVGKGRISLEELNQQAGEALPGLIQTAGRATANTTASLIKMIESGNVLAEELLPKLATQLSLESQSGLAAAANTAQAKLNRLNNEILHSQKIIGGFAIEAIKPAIDTATEGLKLFNENSAIASRIAEVLAIFIGVNVVQALVGVATKLGLVSLLMKALGLSGLSLQGALLNLPSLASNLFKALLVPTAVTVGLELLFASLNRDSQKLKDVNTALETSIRNIEKAYEKAGGAADKFKGKATPNQTEPQAENPVLRWADRLVVNPINRALDFLNLTPNETFGGTRPANATPRLRLRTSGEAAQQDIIANREDTLLKLKSALNKSGLLLNDSKFLDRTIEQIKSLDLQIQRIQAKQNVVRLEGSTEEVQKLQKELDRLQENRKSVLEKVFGNRGDFENIKRQLEEAKDEFNRLISVGALTEGAAAPTLNFINILLKETEQQMGAVENVTKATAAALENLKVKVAAVSAAFENSQYQAELSLSVTKAAILEQQATGGLGENVARRTTLQADQESYKERLRQLANFTQQYQAAIDQLTQGEREALETYLGKSIESAGSGDIKRVQDFYEGNLKGNQEVILEARQKMLDLQKEMSTTAQSIAQGAVELQTSLRDITDQARELRHSTQDFTREYGNFIRGIINQTKDAALDIQSLKNQIRTNDFKTDLLRALTTTSKGIFGTINDVMIRYLEEAGQVAQQSLDRQRQQQQFQNQIIDLRQQNQQQGRQYENIGRQVDRFNQANSGQFLGTGIINTAPYTVYSGGRAVTSAEQVNEHHDGRAYHREHFHGRAEKFRSDGGIERLVKDVVLAQGGNQAVSVPSPVSGIVRLKSSFESGGYGNLAEILNQQGQVIARLAHLAHFAPGLRSGQQISYGQTLGTQGNTGRSSGTHLHLELPPHLFDKYFKDLRAGTFASLVVPQSANNSGINRLLHIIAKAESDFNPQAHNSIGARGAFQFIPSTRKAAIQRTGLDPWAGGIQQQAEAAAAWIRHTHPRAYQAAKNNDLNAAIKLLKNEWTSLPGAAENTRWRGSAGEGLLQQLKSGNFTPHFNIQSFNQFLKQGDRGNANIASTPARVVSDIPSTPLFTGAKGGLLAYANSSAAVQKTENLSGNLVAQSLIEQTFSGIKKGIGNAWDTIKSTTTDTIGTASQSLQNSAQSAKTILHETFSTAGQAIEKTFVNFRAVKNPENMTLEDWQKIADRWQELHPVPQSPKDMKLEDWQKIADRWQELHPVPKKPESGNTQKTDTTSKVNPSAPASVSITTPKLLQLPRVDLPKVNVPKVDLSAGTNAIADLQQAQTQKDQLTQTLQEQNLDQFQIRLNTDVTNAITQRSDAFRDQGRAIRELIEQQSNFGQQYQRESIAGTIVTEAINIERSFRGLRESYEKESIQLQKDIAGGKEIIKTYTRQIQELRASGTPQDLILAEAMQRSLDDAVRSLPQYEERLRQIREQHGRLKEEGQQAINFTLGEALRKATLEGNDALRSLQRSMRDTRTGYKDLVSQFQSPSFARDLEKGLTDVDRQFESFSDNLRDRNVELTKQVQELESQLSSTGSLLNEALLSGNPVLVLTLGQLQDRQQAQLAESLAALAQNEAQGASLPYEQRNAKLFERLRLTRQNRQEREQYLVDTEANVVEGRARRPGVDEYEAARLQAAAATIRENLRFKIEMEGFEELVAKLNLTTEQAAIAKGQLAEINQMNLEGIRNQADLLSKQISDGLVGAFSNLFTESIDGTKSLGEAFTAFGRSVLGTFAQIFAQMAAQRLVQATGGMFGGFGFGGMFSGGGTVGNYALGGTVKDEVPPLGLAIANHTSGGIIKNFALGGLAEPLSMGFGIMNAMRREGIGAVPIVASAGEEVLSTRNSDAQFYRALKRSNAWDEMKQSHVQNFNVGGTVGATHMQPTPQYRAGQRVTPASANVTVNMTISTPDANSFRRSESQMARDFAFKARRAFERNN